MHTTILGISLTQILIILYLLLILLKIAYKYLHQTFRIKNEKDIKYIFPEIELEDDKERIEIIKWKSEI